MTRSGQVSVIGVAGASEDLRDLGDRRSLVPVEQTRHDLLLDAFAWVAWAAGKASGFPGQGDKEVGDDVDLAVDLVGPGGGHRPRHLPQGRARGRRGRGYRSGFACHFVLRGRVGQRGRGLSGASVVVPGSPIEARPAGVPRCIRTVPSSPVRQA